MAASSSIKATAADLKESAPSLSGLPSPVLEESERYEDEEDDVLVEVDDESTASEESSIAQISLGAEETKFVNKFRILLLILLVCTALGVSLSAFALTKIAEYEDFEAAIASHARKIIEQFETEAVQKRTALIHLSRELTSHALYANMTWPFVHLPDWELRAMLTRQLADVIGIFVLPLVTRENLEAWGQYTKESQKWYWEGLAVQYRSNGQTINRTGIEHFDEHSLFVDGDVYQFDPDHGPNQELFHVPDDHPGPFFPCWQYTPQIEVPVINSDFLTMSEMRKELQAYVDNDERRNLVGPAGDFAVGSGGAVFVDLLLQRYNAGGGGGGNGPPPPRGGGGGGGGGDDGGGNRPSRQDDNDNMGAQPVPPRRKKPRKHYTGGPISYYYIPIYEQFRMDSPLAGVLMSFVYWETYFERLLPEDAVGIEVVLENTCGQVYTFEIHGPESNFVGDGDLHNTKYDDCSHHTHFGVFLQHDAQKAAKEDQGGCLYKISVYPTQEMENKYITSRPLVICLSILGTFVFTTLAFILYDRFVERRQQIVLSSAQESGNVVRKLFPEEVRERLYQNENINKTNHQTQPSHNFLQSQVNKRRSSSIDSPDLTGDLSDPLQGASPIADEYLNCTVFFADLAGFTKWSSSRTPSEVFLLLETVYGAFDKIAKKLNVFKIETIGDCYVAVTGLPKPQEDHAIIMCKFAASCIFKFNQLVNSENLLLSLGDETAGLQVRVGIHSGPVTAGVLRGAKARFQLFGDTVNTASRMESNGQKGKIQASQDTADILVVAGKAKWLSAREDLVEAKGKGKMQTFWVDVSSDPSMRTSSRSSGSSRNSQSGLDYQAAVASAAATRCASQHQDEHHPNSTSSSTRQLEVNDEDATTQPPPAIPQRSNSFTHIVSV